MQVPLEITYRDVRKTDYIEELIKEKVTKLERICDHITSCHVAIERPQSNIPNGNPYRIRLNIRIPHNKEIVVKKEPGQGATDEPLHTAIRDSFEVALRRLRNAVEKKQRKVKKHSNDLIFA